MSVGPIASREDADDEEITRPFCLYSIAPAAPTVPINYLVQLQNQVLQQVAEQTMQIAGLIRRISGVKKQRKTENKGSESREEDCRPLKLVLTSDLCTPILKERGFRLAGAVKDTEGCVAPHMEGTSLSLSLFTEDQPTKALELNIAGKKALRGTVSAKVDSSGHFLFPNVVINEVSSHYIDDVFTLVVHDVKDSLQPMVLRRLSVRARKAKA